MKTLPFYKINRVLQANWISLCERSGYSVAPTQEENDELFHSFTIAFQEAITIVCLIGKLGIEKDVTLSLGPQPYRNNTADLMLIDALGRMLLASGAQRKNQTVCTQLFRCPIHLAEQWQSIVLEANNDIRLAYSLVKGSSLPNDYAGTIQGHRGSASIFVGWALDPNTKEIIRYMAFQQKLLMLQDILDLQIKMRDIERILMNNGAERIVSLL